MYGKAFEQMYSGSLVGTGLNTYAVWGYVIATKDQDGMVELNPRLLAGIFGCEITEIEKAIKFLTSPDPHSRTPDHEGIRLLHQCAFTYFVVTHEKYSGLKTEADRRQYMKEYMRKKRKQEKDAVNVNKVNGKQNVKHIDVDVDVDVQEDVREKEKKDKTPLAVQGQNGTERQNGTARPPAEKKGGVDFDWGSVEEGEFAPLSAIHARIHKIWSNGSNCFTGAQADLAREHRWIIADIKPKGWDQIERFIQTAKPDDKPPGLLTFLGDPLNCERRAKAWAVENPKRKVFS